MATEWVVPVLGPEGSLFPLTPEALNGDGALNRSLVEAIDGDFDRKAKGGRAGWLEAFRSLDETQTAVDSRAQTAEDAGAVDPAVLREYMETMEERRGRLLRMVERMTHNREDSEDLLQDALMRAYRALPRFRGESQMSTWMTAIVQNTARDYLRSRKTRTLVPIEYSNKEDNEAVALDFADTRENPEESVERREMEALLRAEIRELSPVCRQAIELCVLDGLPHEKAARRLKLSLSSIKSGVFRGKQILHHKLPRRVSTSWKGLAGSTQRTATINA